MTLYFAEVIRTHRRVFYGDSSVHNRSGHVTVEVYAYGTRADPRIRLAPAESIRAIHETNSLLSQWHIDIEDTGGQPKEEAAPPSEGSHHSQHDLGSPVPFAYSRAVCWKSRLLAQHYLACYVEYDWRHQTQAGFGSVNEDVTAFRQTWSRQSLLHIRILSLY